MAKKPALVEKTATIDEIIAAIEAMPATAMYRLKRYAEGKIKALSWAARGRDSEDLINEAVRSTLEGATNGGKGRKWNTERTPLLVDHLRGAVRSIASHWKEAADEDERTASDITYENEAGESVDPVERAESRAVPVDRQHEAKARVDRLIDLFQDDEQCQFVIILKLEGLTPQDIREQLRLSAAEYEATWKKIQYRAQVNGI
jgi:hypothetical protein